MTDRDSQAVQTGDDELAALERAAESRCTSLDDSPEQAGLSEHARLYSAIDDLAAPIRAAITGSDAAPQLPEYEELTEIGRGGMGVVYSGRHKGTQRLDAVKVIRPDRLMASGMDGELRSRFERESHLAARVAHEHIVPVYQVGDSDGCPWYSMQLVDGPSLQELCKGNPLPSELAVRYIERIARALDTVHRHGVLHGDVKPHNILIERESDRPMLTDFGLGDLLIDESRSSNESAAGTLAYMAPEIAQAALDGSSGSVAAVRSVASDVYSLGVTLWFALTGQSPLAESAAPQKKLADIATGRTAFDCSNESGVPAELARICIRCQAVNPEERYRSAGDLADALRDWLNRPSWNQHFPRMRILLWSVLAPLLALSGVAVWCLKTIDASEAWIWLATLIGYVPLFSTIVASQNSAPETDRARRELWSHWIGHAVGTVASLIALRIACHPDPLRTLELAYPCWAAISAVTFFAKSGNFWAAYRQIGIAWSVLAVVLACLPVISPVVFGLSAAVTCITIALGDPAFSRFNKQVRGFE